MVFYLLFSAILGGMSWSFRSSWQLIGAPQRKVRLFGPTHVFFLEKALCQQVSPTILL